MLIRVFKQEDISQIITLFRDTVHNVCKKDYTKTQCDTWAPEFINQSSWCNRFESTYTLVADENGKILGFCNLESDGNVDMFYVHWQHQGEGIGRKMYHEIEKKALSDGFTQMTSDVSITAKPFFESLGWKTNNIYEKNVNGVIFRNNIMVKKL